MVYRWPWDHTLCCRLCSITSGTPQLPSLSAPTTCHQVPCCPSPSFEDPFSPLLSGKELQSRCRNGQEIRMMSMEKHQALAQTMLPTPSIGTRQPASLPHEHRGIALRDGHFRMNGFFVVQKKCLMISWVNKKGIKPLASTKRGRPNA